MTAFSSRYFLRILSLATIPVVTFFGMLPQLASAHEVYVLDQQTIAAAMLQPPLQVFTIIMTQKNLFFFWTFLAVLILISVGFISIAKPLEKICDPFLFKLRRYAPFIGRVTLGLSVLASAYSAALFGPELPMADFLPLAIIPFFRVVLAVMGVLLIAGFFTRVAALVMIGLYGMMVAKYSFYMMTYMNYFGEMIVTFALGSRVWAVDAFFPERAPKFFKSIVAYTVDHSFLLLRVLFGGSLIYAALYAKFFYAQLALDTVIQYRLTDYFHFEPSFIVLGALAVELLLGTLFIIGVEVRFATLFLTVFLTMSLLYFGEAVWPHLILVGGAFTIFAFGYDKFTLERKLLTKYHIQNQNEEPVL